MEFRTLIWKMKQGDFLQHSSREAADSWSRRELLDAAISVASRLDNDFLLLGRRYKAQPEISCQEGGGTTSYYNVAKSPVGSLAFKVQLSLFSRHL